MYVVDPFIFEAGGGAPAGSPNGGDMERVWVALTLNPFAGNEIDRANQELLQRTSMGLHHGIS